MTSDADCYTLPNGECVSDRDCMHGPALTLTDHERRLIDFEREPWDMGYGARGVKENAIRLYMGMSPTSFYQQLFALIDRPAAEAYDQGTVRRLRAERDARRAARASTSFVTSIGNGD